MKRLVVLRHAKAAAGDEARDFDRALDARGHAQTALVGREFERRGIRFDVVVASPAVRVRETLDGLGTLPEVRFERAIYSASAGTLLAMVRALPGAAGQALVAGHNPGVHELVVMLARRGPLSERVAFRYPAAAAALFHFDCDTWAEVAAGSGDLEALIFPDELAP